MQRTLNYEKAIDIIKGINTLEEWRKIYVSCIFIDAICHLNDEQKDNVILHGMAKFHNLCGNKEQEKDFLKCIN